MTDNVQNIQKAIAERDYTASSQIIDRALQEKRIPELVEELLAYEEAAPELTLELRDHVFYYLRMWDIYFAIQISSIDVLRILYAHDVKNEPSIFMIEYIRNLLDTKDARFSQFCVNIETISSGQYAVLIPSILDQRMNELEKCRIPYRESPSYLYCTADLMETYYGGKIVSASHGHRSFDIVVSEEQFASINESLIDAGLDTLSMLDLMELDIWEEYLKSRRKPRIKRAGSGELSMLHRVKSARSHIFSTVFNQQVSALNAIIHSRTQLCNDLLITVASDSSHQMRRRALSYLGESGNSLTIEFLADMMKDARSESIRIEAARAYSALTSRNQILSVAHPIPGLIAKTPVIDIAKVNKILNTLITKGMPSTMIDDTLIALAIQGGLDSVEVLIRLLEKPQMSVRKAVVKASRSLDIDVAAPIVRAALNDEDSEVITMAENELDTRWPDVVWD